MKIEKTKILSILEKVKPGITRTEHIEAMSYFFFSGKDIITYNDKISIQHPFKTDFSLFVKASDLHKIISKLNSDIVTILEKDGKLNITCKKVKASLPTIMDKEVSDRIETISKSLKNVKWKTLPENFSKSISLCYFTASKQESDGTLTCVYVNEKNCVSSDNNRISHAVLTSDIDEMFIKASEVKNLIDTNPIEYAITKAWLHFKNKDGCIFSIRKQDGKYPDFFQFFDFKGQIIELPKEVMEGIDLNSIFVDETNPSVNCKITNGFLFISTKSIAGRITHKSKINHNGNDVLFVINPLFLKEMIKYSSSVIIGDDKIKIKTDDDSFSILTALFTE